MPKQPNLIKHGSVRIKINESVNRGKPLFYFNFYEGGRRHQRNFSTLEAAQAEAANVARKLAHGHGAAISLTGRDRDAYVHALNLLTGLDVPLSAAVEEYVAARRKLDGAPLLHAVDFFLAKNANRLVPKLVEDVVTEFLKAKEEDGASKRYLDDCRLRLGRFASCFRGYIANIHAREIDDWLRSLGLALRTRDNFRGVIVTLFRFAQQRGYLPKGDTEADAVQKPKLKGGEIGIFTPDEFKSLLTAAGENTLPAFAIGGFAGLRQAEILRIHWEEIDFAEELIRVPATKSKTAQRRLVPIVPSLAAWLQPIAKRRGRVLNFSSEVNLSYAMRTVADRAEVKWKHNGLRHSFASYRLAEIKDAQRLSLEMGNSPKVIFEHYRELVTEKQAKLWFSIAPESHGNIISLSDVNSSEEASQADAAPALVLGR